MVRTKDIKVVLGKSSRKKITVTVVEEKTSKGGKYGGGNPYCPRETPAWQKPITTFFPHHNKDLLENELNNGPPSGINSEKDAEKEVNSSGLSDVNHEKKDTTTSESTQLSSDEENMFDIDIQIKDCESGRSDESNEASTHF